MSSSPSRWKYLLAFVLASVITNLLSVAVDIGMSRGMSAAEAQTALLYMPFIGVALALAVWAGVLKLFSSLNLAKMFPWIATLGFLGTAASVGRLHEQMKWVGKLSERQLDISPLVYLMPFLAFAVFLILFRKFFCKPIHDQSSESSET